MKVLQVCNKPPYPARDGGCMAMAAITEGLLDLGHEVRVLCISTEKHPFNHADIPTEILLATGMDHVFIDTRVKVMPAIANLFSNVSYNVSRFYSTAFEERLVAMLQVEHFDIIHLESLFCTPYLAAIRRHTTAKVVLRAHNVEHVIWSRMAAQDGSMLKRAYLNLLAARLRRYEQEVVSQVDAIAVITSQDKDLFEAMGATIPTEVIPMGMKKDALPHPELTHGPLHIYHLASMDWQPNVEAVDHFISNIWPGLHKELPQLICHFAGRNMPERLKAFSGTDLVIGGEVPSVVDMVADKQVMIVPLLSGGGMRVKIVEAMMMGKVVVSTSVGAEGIPYINGEHLLIADGPAAFVEALKRLQADATLMQRIADNGRKLAETHFDQQAVTSRLTYFYRSIS